MNLHSVSVLLAAIAATASAESYPVYIATSDGIMRSTLDTTSGELSEPIQASGQRTIWLTATDGILFGTTNYREADGPTNGGVAAFAIAEDGGLTFLNERSTRGKTPCYVAAAQIDGTTHVAVANFRHDTRPSRGSVATFLVADDGSLRDLHQRFEHPGKGGTDSERQQASHPHSVVYSPDGQFLAVGDLGIDKVLVYAVVPDPQGGFQLEFAAEAHADPGQQPRHVAWHPSGEYLYCMNEGRRTVSALHFDSEEKKLGFIQHADRGRAGSGSGADLKIHPSGAFVYASVRGSNNLVVFAVDPESKTLELAGDVPTGGGNCRSFAISPDGKFLLAANQASRNVTVFRIGEDGIPKPTGRSIEVLRPSCIIFAPEA